MDWNKYKKKKLGFKFHCCNSFLPCSSLKKWSVNFAIPCSNRNFLLTRNFRPCLFQLTYLITMKKDRGKLFVITNRQIVSVISGTFRIIKYQDISFINRRNILKKLYLIELILEKPLIDNPDYILNKFVIPVIPYENDLIIKLKNIIEEETKKQFKITFKRDAFTLHKNYL